MTARTDEIFSLVGASGTGAGVFGEPWQARAFALTVALVERRLFTMRDFQLALIERVRQFEMDGYIADNRDYYTCWIDALSSLLRSRGALAAEALARLEIQVVEDAASRKAHQHAKSRDEFGNLIIAPIVIDRGDSI